MEQSTKSELQTVIKLLIQVINQDLTERYAVKALTDIASACLRAASEIEKEHQKNGKD